MEGEIKEMFRCPVEGCNREFDTEMGLKTHIRKAHEEKASNKRRERVPLGVSRRKLVAEIPPGKVGRWVNDNWSKDPTRIQDALRGGYNFLAKDKTGKVGEEVDDGNQDIGSRISRKVGTNDDGSPITAYLMIIDKELYQEDQKEKQKVNDEIDRQIRRGKLEEKPGDNRYIPSSGINIETKVTP